MMSDRPDRDRDARMDANAGDSSPENPPRSPWPAVPPDSNPEDPPRSPWPAVPPHSGPDEPPRSPWPAAPPNSDPEDRPRSAIGQRPDNDRDAEPNADAPEAPDAGFGALGLREALRRGLQRAGFVQPTPVQRQVLPPALAGADLLVSAATGTGKTAAFLLPMMQRFLNVPAHDRATRGLILVPTRELARQIREHFMALGSFTRLGVGIVAGGESKARQIALLRRNPEFLIATPGRLLEFLNSGAATLRDLEILVLDEADRMLDLGFADDVLKIIAASRPERQSLLFSATLQHRGLRALIDPLLRDPLRIQVDPMREPHPDIAHRLILSDDQNQKQRQLLWLLGQETWDRALIFVNTRERATALGGFLMAQGQRAAVLHGELTQDERNRVMGLLHSGRVATLVATDLAARGLDIPGLDLVCNFDPPRSGDDYLHRTGRTGRAGARGRAVTLVEPGEWNRLESIARYLGIDFERIVIAGLKARFKGQAPVRGKRKAAADRKTEAPKPKERLRDRKNIGKRRLPASGRGTEAGHAPLARPRGGPDSNPRGTGRS